ncbi:MAG: hypothetical protein IT443_10130 [Phycisphaeraceae bacterium]|nr:hypothetical protein [Phycisphaeraceae bacterium]
MTSPPPSHSSLSPWPIRLAVFIALILIAFAAIRLIDRHVMARHQPVITSSPPSVSFVYQSRAL